MVQAPDFHGVSGATVGNVIEENRAAVFEAVETARTDSMTKAIPLSPQQLLLLYPDRPSARIIALPAHLGGSVQKTVSSGFRAFLKPAPSTLPGPRPS